MSKWTDVRDNIVDVLKVDDVTDELKDNVTKKLLDEVLPIIENAVDGFTSATKDQSKKETGWCKIRDGIVLPFVMDGLVFVVRTALEKTVVKTS